DRPPGLSSEAYRLDGLIGAGESLATMATAVPVAAPATTTPAMMTLVATAIPTALAVEDPAAPAEPIPAAAAAVVRLEHFLESILTLVDCTRLIASGTGVTVPAI